MHVLRPYLGGDFAVIFILECESLVTPTLMHTYAPKLKPTNFVRNFIHLRHTKAFWQIVAFSHCTEWLHDRDHGFSVYLLLRSIIFCWLLVFICISCIMFCGSVMVTESLSSPSVFVSSLYYISFVAPSLLGLFYLTVDRTATLVWFELACDADGTRRVLQ